MLNITLADARIGQIKIKTPKRMYGTVQKIQLLVPGKNQHGPEKTPGM
jgi:hypothetical protein